MIVCGCMPQNEPDLVQEAYKNADETADQPFPDEELLRVIIPQEQLRPLRVPEELIPLFDEPKQETLPIIKLLFPGGSGSALVLAPMIPFTLMEFALLKVRNYLLRHGNREYVRHRLNPQLAGREAQLQEILDQIAIRPSDCLKDLNRHREVSFYFWSHFCTLIRSDLTQKKELLAEELAALQAVHIIDAFNIFMKTKAARAKEAELAFRNFELEMDKVPYYFSRESIMRFKDNKGVPLLNMCSQETLDEYIKKRSTETSKPNELPDFVYFRSSDGISWLVKKTRVLTVCARLLAETRPLVINAIFNRWKIMLKEFRKESAMDDDKSFETLIAGYIKDHAPMLQAVLYDAKLRLIYEEMQSSQNDAPQSFQLFVRNELQPFRVLLNIKRKQILSDVKLLIPFWYRLLNDFLAFFKNRRKKKKSGRKETENKKENTGGDPLGELQTKALEVQSRIVPRGQTLDSYLKTVSFRWVELINKQAYNDLIEDVHTLIRDCLRSILRSKKTSLVSPDALDTIAYNILDSSTGLRKIRDQSSLLLYIKLYIIKLLTAKKSPPKNPL